MKSTANDATPSDPLGTALAKIVIAFLLGLLGLAWMGWWVVNGGVIHGETEDYLLAAIGFAPLFAAVYLLKGW